MSTPGVPCPGCGVILPDSGGAPGHPGSSSGCWAAYGDLLAREYADWGSPRIQRLTVDTYGAQHPGEPTRESGQALGGHLVGLHLALERGIEPGRVGRELGRVVADPSAFHWIEPPQPGGQLTIVDVMGSRTLREHVARVERWARSVWEAWADHHELIRAWAGR